MGYIIFHNADGSKEILGDEQAARRDEGLPYHHPLKGYQSQETIDDNDKAGE